MPRARPQKPATSEQIAQLCAAAALDKKAENLSLLHVASLNSYTDYFLIASASSTRQVSAVADYIHLILKKAGIKPLGISGIKEGQWALIDFGPVVAHVFYRPIREFYDLESLWADAPRAEIIPQELAVWIPAPKRGQAGNRAKKAYL